MNICVSNTNSEVTKRLFLNHTKFMMKNDMLAVKNYNEPKTNRLD